MKDWNNPDEEESEEESTSGIVPLTQYSIDDMELITTIGIGAFGRVELVRPIGDETRSFALKKMAKFRIVEQDQQEHIKNEKNLLMTLNNDFIVKCYQSFRFDYLTLSNLSYFLEIVNLYICCWMRVLEVKFGQ